MCESLFKATDKGGLRERSKLESTATKINARESRAIIAGSLKLTILARKQLPVGWVRREVGLE